ncbi:NAD(P)H-dependent oxidoreductase [Pseudonocardia nematodicida]|uniref:NAD(P)H-dependent oxidoreductase n=1 Tax=Pseudonocardia nematodicida TaxID=1206997 RepID=A0ABV1KGR0_9PSEU
MTRIAIVIGSTRPGRRGELVARWIKEKAEAHATALSGAATYEIVDLADVELPLLNEPLPPLFGQYQQEPTRRWAETVAGFDGFVVVTPEYNHGIPAVLKNAIDHLYAEWNNKAAGFVSYGVHGGVRAAEHLRQVFAEVKVPGVRSQVALGLFTDFRIEDPTETGVLEAGPHHDETVGELLDEVVAWSDALAPLRDRAAAAA